VFLHVCDRKGMVHGIRFLFSRWYAVTCAHVINAALSDLTGERPDFERVCLTFFRAGQSARPSEP
jgi:hypothetical protein